MGREPVDVRKPEVGEGLAPPADRTGQQKRKGVCPSFLLFVFMPVLVIVFRLRFLRCILRGNHPGQKANLGIR